MVTGLIVQYSEIRCYQESIGLRLDILTVSGKKFLRVSKQVCVSKMWLLVLYRRQMRWPVLFAFYVIQAKYLSVIPENALLADHAHGELN